MMNFRVRTVLHIQCAWFAHHAFRRLSFIILVPFWCGASFKSIKCVYSTYSTHLWDHENDIVTKRVYFVTFFQSWNHKLPGAFKANLTKKIFAERRCSIVFYLDWCCVILKFPPLNSYFLRKHFENDSRIKIIRI